METRFQKKMMTFDFFLLKNGIRKLLNTDIFTLQNPETLAVASSLKDNTIYQQISVKIAAIPSPAAFFQEISGKLWTENA